MSAPAVASQSAAAAVKKVGACQRFVVDPTKKFLCCVVSCAKAKVANLPPAMQERIAADTEKGIDTAALSSKRFYHEQKGLMAYRVVRLKDEACHVFSGEYFKNYGIAKALDDLRFLTQCLFLFIIFVLIGRRSVYPPIKPDSPFVIALENKTNPNY